MDIGGVARTTVSVLVPLFTLVGTLIGIGSRRNRLRREVRENLELLQELERDEVLRDRTVSAAWLRARIHVDVARLTGQKLGVPKKPLPKGGMITVSFLAAVLGTWTWWLSRDGFAWYSVFPGAAAFLLLVSLWGMTLNREIGPDSGVPPGASAVSSRTHVERIATQLVLESEGNLSGNAEQVGVVYRFVGHMEVGSYEEALGEAEDVWLRCRLQAWVWNNSRDGEIWAGESREQLQSRADAMFSMRSDCPEWEWFVDSERRQFVTAWGGEHAVSGWGAGSRRRRLSEDCDLVILAPLGGTEGYYVETATSLPQAIQFVVRKTDGRWRVVNHLGFSPPAPGMPPVWWSPADQTWNAFELPEAGNRSGEDRPAASVASEDTDRSLPAGGRP